MRVPVLSFVAWLSASSVYAQHSALVVTTGRGGRVSVAPVGVAENTLGAESFEYRSGGSGGCGVTPTGNTFPGSGGGPLLSRDGRRIVYAAEGQLVVRTLGDASQLAIPRSDYDVPCCLIAMAADSSSVLYYRVARFTPPPPDDDDGGAEPEIEGQFEIYSFVSRQTVALRSLAFADDPGAVVLIDDNTLALTQNLPGGDRRRRLVVVDLRTNMQTEIATTEGNALTFGQLGYFSGWLVWLDGEGRTQFHQLRPSSVQTTWQALPGTWAEFQWNRLSPSGSRLARIHSLGNGTLRTLEMIEAGSAQSRVLAQNPRTFHWESDDSILYEEYRGYPSHRLTHHLMRIDIAAGTTTELLTAVNLGQARVDFPM